jgi:hypothetical protein
MRKFTPEWADAADKTDFVFVTGCDCAGELSFAVGRERLGREGVAPSQTTGRRL